MQTENENQNLFDDDYSDGIYKRSVMHFVPNVRMRPVRSIHINRLLFTC